MVSQEELSSWTKKYSFLESIIEESERDIFKIEEGEMHKILRCLPRGNHSASGEETSWQWYGVKGKTVKPLIGTSIGDAVSKERFEYVISVDDIDAPNFSDRSIFVYPVESGSNGSTPVSRNPLLHRMEISDMNHCIRTFGKSGLVITGAKDIALARINEDSKNPVHDGSWIGEGIVYIEDNQAMIINSRYNPRVNYEKLYRFEEYDNRGFVNNLRIDPQSMDEIIKMASEDRDKEPQHKRVLQISRFQGEIPISRFNSDELSLFLFGDAALSYSQYLGNKGIDNLPFHFPEEHMGISDSPMEALAGAIMGIDYSTVGKSKTNRPFMDMLWLSYDNIHWNSKIIKNFRDSGSVCFYGVKDIKNGR